VREVRDRAVDDGLVYRTGRIGDARAWRRGDAFVARAAFTEAQYVASNSPLSGVTFKSSCPWMIIAATPPV
jgi:hypothetical protein